MFLNKDCKISPSSSLHLEETSREQIGKRETGEPNPSVLTELASNTSVYDSFQSCLAEKKVQDTPEDLLYSGYCHTSSLSECIIDSLTKEGIGSLSSFSEWMTNNTNKNFLNHIKNPKDLRNYGNLEKKLLQKFPLFIKIDSDKKIQLIHYFGNDGCFLNMSLKIMLSFWKDFTNLIQKKDLSKPELLQFESFHPELQHSDMFGSSFLGHSFFSSRLSHEKQKPEENNYLLQLLQFVLYRYKTSIEVKMSIRKALGIKDLENLYKELAKCFLAEVGILYQSNRISLGKTPIPNFYNLLQNEMISI